MFLSLSGGGGRTPKRKKSLFLKPSLTEHPRNKALTYFVIVQISLFIPTVNDIVNWDNNLTWDDNSQEVEY